MRAAAPHFFSDGVFWHFISTAGDDSSLSYVWEEVGGYGYEQLGIEIFEV